ncbi:MAG TPA: DEAD/DEAH box helicase [Candidatus Limnocylindria bacterium]|nr:DEAD/DEAH box helicase [Candidatus Limnocylindria bacterium]
MIAFHPDLDRAVKALGWVELTPIQTRVIPLVRAGRDVIAQAQTGTGKTGAFALPLLERVSGPARKPFVLVVVPTRELCIQVARDFATLGKYRGVRVSAVYGGNGYGQQERELRGGAHVVVGTPGRLLDLVARRSLDLGSVKVLILDEADRLLDLGFINDVKRIVAFLPKGRQTALFSATFPSAVDAVARAVTIDAERVSVKPEQPTIDTVDQSFVEVRHVDKLRALREVLGRDEASRVLVFRRTKRGADKLARDLVRLGHDAAALHGDVPQRARERVLEGFRRGTVSTLVATNLAARGIHVDGIDHVVNFDLPEDPETYVHRIGRTGRAGERGRALTFVTETQRAEFLELKRKARVPFRQEQLAIYS